MWSGGLRFESPNRFREPAFFDSAAIQDLMLDMVAGGVSDLFMTSGLPMICVQQGLTKQVTTRSIMTSELMFILKYLTNRPESESQISRGEPVAGSYAVNDRVALDARGELKQHRFRINGSRFSQGQQLGLQIVCRTIASEPPSIDYVKLDKPILDACTPRNGVIFVTGPTGSGKTTTFAAIVRYILENNTSIFGNILTLEQPIEYVYSSVASRHSIVAQHEVALGADIPTFAAGVRDFMRRYPALAVVGETRDWETAEAVIELANTGHPVFTTSHVNEVAMVFQRILKLCPANSRDGALFDLITTTRMMVSQALARTVDGKRTALREYLVVTPALREEMYMKATPDQIIQYVRGLVKKHGKTMAQAANEAYESGLIADEERMRFQEVE